ncbi:hypothetical protein CXG81DRAFT_12036, partial [Caulochytrium protostelioides]
MPISAHVALGQLRVDLYLEVLITLLCEPCPYPLFQQLLDELPQQLANLPLWHEAIREIRTLRSVLCSMVLKERAFENITDVPPALAKTTVYRQLIYVLLILLPFHQHFNRQQHEELVMVFQTGLSKWPVANKLCIHALQVCLYEFPSLMTKALPGLLMKISQNMATSMGIPNLEFLAALADLPALTRNLTETDYRRILAIGLQHINNVSPPHDATPATKASLVYLEQLAFYVITLWFTSIRLMDRRRYVPFIIHYLQRDTSVTEEENRANTQLVMDMLITSTFANCWSRTKQRSIASGVMATPGMPLGGAAAPLTKAWLFNNCIMTMTMIDDRWCEIWIRRPSGLVSFTIHLDNPLKEHTHSATMTTAHAMAADSGSGGGGRDASSATGLGMPPAATFPELPPILAYQHLFDAAFPSAAAAPTSASPFGDLRSPPPPPSAPSPASLPEDDAVRRALGVLDRTPVVDLHKIGVTYVATGQSHEREILLNEHGSRAYSLFLQSMGRMAKLRGNHDIYTGGLDIEHDIDGEYAIYWQDDLSQLILHSTTLMPSGTPQPAATAEPAALLPSQEAALINKKRHIGNDYVLIVWNDSGMPYRFETIPGQFNLVNIVITP